MLNGAEASVGSPEAEPVTAQTFILPWMPHTAKTPCAASSVPCVLLADHDDFVCAGLWHRLIDTRHG